MTMSLRSCLARRAGVRGRALGGLLMAAWATGAVVPVARGEWRPEVFDYDRPARLEVTERGEPADKLPDTRQQELTFTNLRGEQVPVLISLPPKGKGPFPAVLLVHPLGGNRRQMTQEVVGALTGQGLACVALDLPMHGARATGKSQGEELFVADDPSRSYRNMVGAVMDIRQTLDLLNQRKDLDMENGVPMIGYSMGAWFGTLAGAADRRVPLLVLLGAGAPTPTAEKPKGLFQSSKGEQALLERFPTIRPEIAIAGFGRPLLMQNGKKDPFVSEESVRQLYRQAKAPKELRWYDSGHILPEKAAMEAAEWIVKHRRR